MKIPMKKKKRAWPRPTCPNCTLPISFKQAIQDAEGVWKHLNC